MIQDEVRLIIGDLAIDDRGSVRFVNDFDFAGVKRFYMVENHQAGFVRAWHAHRREGKYIMVVQGAAIVAAIKIEDWKNPPSDPGVYGWGDGMLYYPDLGPSVRLEMIRDGIDDYEYFCILDRLTKDQPDHPARKLLSIPEDIVQEVARYTTDPQLLRAYRRKLAEAIEELSTSQ